MNNCKANDDYVNPYTGETLRDWRRRELEAIEDMFMELCSHVAQRTGEKPVEVLRRLRAGVEKWNEKPSI